MGVLLRTTAEGPGEQAFDRWLSVTGTHARLPLARRLEDLPRRLQDSFDGIRDRWLAIAARLGTDPVGRLSHTATGAAYINDFGLMLAWSDLVEALAGEEATTLVLCDDPWLFRHLAGLLGVDAGAPPPIWASALRSAVRGVAARMRLAVRLAGTALAMRRYRGASRTGAPALLVYGHPQSDAAGNDAYFGGLMKEIPDLVRLLHADCAAGRARELCADGRTASLHGWGSIGFAAMLPFVRWSVPAALDATAERWLLRRAAARENATAALAMTRWQEHCHTRWLRAARPSAIAWPWENHPWERTLCRAARGAGVPAIGYQHAVIGRHQFNFSPRSNPDGTESLPTHILCNGPAYHRQLIALGHGPSTLSIAGAFRVAREGTAFHDADGPVYVALSAIEPIARQMLAVTGDPALADLRFVVKDHPLYPIEFAETARVRRTSKTIPESAGLRAVVYSTGTTGLEGLLAGVPTYRFLPDDRIAPDTLPDGIEMPERTANELPRGLLAPEPPAPVTWSDVMSPVDLPVWRAALAPQA